jgi:hypothetical protein
MAEFIVDTNVPLVASGLSEQMSIECQKTCFEFLEKLINGNDLVVIDDQYWILGEYEHEMKRQGTYGHQFLKWLLRNSHDLRKVKFVTIHPVGKSEYDFEEFPETLEAVDFDNSDRKYVAVAVANNFVAPIVEAADSKWIGWQEALAAEGIGVVFLCKKELEEIYERKMMK